jgi:hypothetical protein
MIDITWLPEDPLKWGLLCASIAAYFLAPYLDDRN